MIQGLREVSGVVRVPKMAESMLSKATVVKSGWLLKKGEFIPSWSPRYFLLKSDGSFRGYKSIPKAGDAPINYFDILNSTLSLDDKSAKSGKYGFVVRFMQMTRVIERSFHLESAADRAEWVKAYEDTRNTLESANAKQVASLGTTSTNDITSRMRGMSFVEKGKPKPVDMSLDDFEMLKVLGKGTFGKVMLSKLKSTKEVFAIKVLKKSMVLEKDELAHTLTENSVLAKCVHPFLTSLKYSFQTPELLCFVMEYVNGGELFFHLSKEKRFSEDRTRFYIAQITMAITYLHSEGIIYRDLKLENLMLDQNGDIKITDFGLCKEEIQFGSTTTTFCGTPEYLAPEVIEDSDYGRTVDWWGVGVVMYEMISGMLPFRSRDHEELFGLILTQELKVPAWFTPLAKDCVTKLLIKDPSLRLGGGERDGHDIMAHPFFAPINFAKLEAKEIPPPFVPKISSATDTANFDPYFTNEQVRLTPPEGAPVAAADQVQFKPFEALQKKQ